MKILLLSIYEAGFQPLSLAYALAALKEKDIGAQGVDLFVEPLEIEMVREAELVAVSLPLFDSVRPGCLMAAKIRELNPGAYICFFGTYAVMNRDILVGRYCDCCIPNEDYLAYLAVLLGKSEKTAASEINKHLEQTLPVNPAKLYRKPLRGGLPDLSYYGYQRGLLKDKIIGNVETTRGCRFSCVNCSVFRMAKGNVSFYDQDAVISDIADVVERGASHITFVDAEFFNNPTHGVEVVRKMKETFPELTFDFTSRVDRILHFKEAIKELVMQGCSFITTALEFPSELVLKILKKGFGPEKILELMDFSSQINLKLNPTLMLFNPWVSLEEIFRAEEFLEKNRLVEVIDPIQFATRLIIHKGSPLLDSGVLTGVKLKEREFHFDWEHGDAGVDSLYKERLNKICVDGAMARCCIKC